MATAGESDHERQIEELLRVNAELAAEIRELVSGRAGEPRPRLAPAARRLTRLIAERDSLIAERDSLIAERDSLATELEAAQAERQRQQQHNDDLSRGLDEQAAELERLRVGILGLLRRAVARLLRQLG